MSIIFTPGERQIFQARERNSKGYPLSVSECAEKYRVITEGPAKGRWTNSYTPFAVDPMDAFSTPHIRKIYVCAGPQIFKTQFAINCLLWAAIMEPGPALYVMKTEHSIRRLSKRKIIPAFRKSPKLAALLSDRNDDTTTLSIKLKNGMDILMGWSTSPSVLASESYQYVFQDEAAKYDDFSGKEASAGDLISQRTNAFPYTSKNVIFSTPVDSGNPFTRGIEEETDIFYKYMAVCQTCKTPQVMTRDGLYYPEGAISKDIIRAKLGRYECIDCKFKWTDIDRDKAVLSGYWQPHEIPKFDSWDNVSIITNPVERPSTVSYHLPAFCSKKSLSDSAARKLESLKSPKKLFTFVTQHEANPYFETVNKKREGDVLKLKTNIPRDIVPTDAIALTAGIDTQKNGFWYVVRAWGKDFTSWLISYGFMEDFNSISTLLNTKFQKQNGSEYLPIWRAAIDTGGGRIDKETTRTEEVYQFLRNYPKKNQIWGIKGASRKQINRIKHTNIDKFPNSNKPIPGGIQLKILDTEEFKDLIDWRMTRKKSEDQRFYLNSDTGLDYVQQILAEEKRRDKTGKITRHVKKNNHLYDCEVYAASCVDAEWTPSFQWVARQQEVVKKEIVEPKKEQKKEIVKPIKERKW